MSGARYHAHRAVVKALPTLSSGSAQHQRFMGITHVSTSHTATGMYGRVHSYADYLYSCDTYENYGSFLFVHTKIRLSDVSRQRSHPQEH